MPNEEECSLCIYVVLLFHVIRRKAKTTRSGKRVRNSKIYSEMRHSDALREKNKAYIIYVNFVWLCDNIHIHFAFIYCVDAKVVLLSSDEQITIKKQQQNATKTQSKLKMKWKTGQRKFRKCFLYIYYFLYASAGECVHLYRSVCVRAYVNGCR